MTEWPIQHLHPHRLQDEVYPEAKVNAQKLALLRESLAAHGLDHPIRVTPDGTIMDGVHRWRIAQELGWTTIAVEVLPGGPESPEAQRVFYEANVGSVHDDPMVLARVIRRSKELHEIRRGRPIQTMENNSAPGAELGAAAGVGERQARNLDRLNELIPELQDLVSARKLGVAIGAALARLASEEQRALYEAVGERVGDLKKSDATLVRQVAEDRNALQRQLAQLQADFDAAEAARAAAEERVRVLTADRRPDVYQDLAAELAEARQARATAEATARGLQQQVRQLQAHLAHPQVVEKLVERVVADPAQAAELAVLKDRLTSLEAERDALTAQLSARAADTDLDRRRDTLQREIAHLERELGAKRTGLEFMAVGRRMAQAVDREWATLQGLATGELDGVFWPEVAAWSERLRQVADSLDRLRQRPAAARVIDITNIEARRVD